MAYVAGAGSIITLLGSARAAVALGFFKDITGRSISFFQLTYYMLPLGVIMLLAVWAAMMLLYRPEHPTIPGLRERARRLYASLGPVTRNERVIVTSC
jgi:sodium-dependent dicarboxylate transporter 2/3/5